MTGHRKGLRLLPFALLNERRSINVGSGECGEGIFLRSIFSQISDTSYLGGILRFEGGGLEAPKISFAKCKRRWRGRRPSNTPMG